MTHVDRKSFPTKASKPSGTPRIPLLEKLHCGHCMWTLFCLECFPLLMQLYLFSDVSLTQCCVLRTHLLKHQASEHFLLRVYFLVTDYLWQVFMTTCSVSFQLSSKRIYYKNFKLILYNIFYSYNV